MCQQKQQTKKKKKEIGNIYIYINISSAKHNKGCGETLAQAGLKTWNEQARLMFYSGAVWEAFRGREKKIKESQVSGSFAHSPLALTPLASAEAANRGWLSNFRYVKITLGNLGFAQDFHQRVWLEHAEITKGSQDPKSFKIKRGGGAVEEFSCLRSLSSHLRRTNLLLLLRGSKDAQLLRGLVFRSS